MVDGLLENYNAFRDAIYILMVDGVAMISVYIPIHNIVDEWRWV